jgi:Wzt C-terminal domain/Sulfotransferase domain
VNTADVELLGQFWPPPDAFWMPAADEQWTDGSVRCTGIAVCDEDGGPARAAHQGQLLHFLFEFEVERAAGLPSGWLELRDAAGNLIHGRSSFQDGWSLRVPVDGPVRLRYRYAINLDVAPGDYYVTVGLSSTDEGTYVAYWHPPDAHTVLPSRNTDRSTRYRQVGLPEEEFARHVNRQCEATLPDPVVVGFDDSGRRRFNGLVGLRGDGSATAVDVLDEPTSRSGAPTAPTVIHVTHYKAGSQWIYAILQACVPDRVAAPDARSGHFRYWPPEPGKVYPTVYLTRQEYDTVRVPPDTRVFVVVRDLRDTLVSAYFSLVKTHEAPDRPSIDLRRLLSSLSKEEGLVFLIDQWLPDAARIQLSWLEAGEPLIRYEDLLDNDVEILEDVLLDRCALGVPRDEFRRIVLSKRFEELTGGRARGDEDRDAHTRKGVAGDWRNHFTGAVTRAFKARYGGLLVATGYERDLDW